MKTSSTLRRLGSFAALVACAVIVLTSAAVSAPLPAAATPAFAVLGGTAVTCTASTVTGDIGIWPGIAVTRTGCVVTGTIHVADAAAEQAYLDFVTAYNRLRDHPPACRQA